MNTVPETLPDPTGMLLSSVLPNTGDVVAAEAAFWAHAENDLEASQAKTIPALMQAINRFLATAKPVLFLFPVMVSAAKHALEQAVRIKRLEATLQVVQGLIVNRTEVLAATDEARFRFIQGEVGAALLGIEKPYHLAIVIGEKAYLDITLAEAQARYLKTTGVEPLPSMIRSFLFVDEFTEEVKTNGV